jgi:hypothetical protein
MKTAGNHLALCICLAYSRIIFTSRISPFSFCRSAISFSRYNFNINPKKGHSRQ